jgi:hypothetical protein
VLALPGAPTARHVFSPWAGSLPARGVRIEATLKGSCSHGSELLTRFDAWRCEAAGRSYDPCFANARTQVGAHVLCLPSPSTDATAIELTRALPLDLANPGGDAQRFPPWAMVTAAGQECALAGRPLARIAGLPASYACAGAGVLLGVPSRGRTWTQLYASTVKAKTARRVPLRAVWW